MFIEGLGLMSVGEGSQLGNRDFEVISYNFLFYWNGSNSYLEAFQGFLIESPPK